MKANKVTVTVKVEVLHIDSVPAQLFAVAARLREEYIEGTLTAEDGDTVIWATDMKEVEF